MQLSYKLLSEDPSNYDDACREGIRRILQSVTGIEHPIDNPIDSSRIFSIRMATTVATNALLERKGEPFALAITSGFRDLLQIGNQSRPDIFDLNIKKPENLYAIVVEVDERVTLPGFTAGGLGGIVDVDTVGQGAKVKGRSGETVSVIKPLDLELVRHQLQGILDSGITNLAIAFMHSYTYPDHELAVCKLAKQMGFKHITMSSEIIPMIKLVLRGSSACVDSFLTPCIQRYISSFVSGFDDMLLKNTSLLFMQSDGGLVASVDHFSGFKSILSGPAGGFIGYSKTSYSETDKSPIIGFDMGGTSTDISRFSGSVEHVFESVIADVSLSVPQLDIQTVAAGGGSCLTFQNGLLRVGPDSAGAHPGPACYRKGGPLTITDANLILGRIQPDYFPKIFGPSENESLDIAAARFKFGELLTQIRSESDICTAIPNSIEDLAYGFIKVANEQMCRPIRALTQEKGFDSRNDYLACFGGAGAQHACALAKILGIKKIYIHRYASILSAYGLRLSDIVQEAQEPCALIYDDSTLDLLKEKLNSLKTKTLLSLKANGIISKEPVRFDFFLNLRYEGTDTAIMTGADNVDQDFKQIFETNYRREFGFTLSQRGVLVDDIRVRATACSGNDGYEYHPNPNDYDVFEGDSESFDIYFEHGFEKCRLVKISSLSGMCRIEGPALLLDMNNTVVVEPHCVAFVDVKKNIIINVLDKKAPKRISQLDPVQLSIFGHRFMSIAEQMGRTLQRTSVSTNIKERLDFSCALFGNDGGLVANAPHIPVHLGSMQEAVRWQLNFWGDSLSEGDVLVTNHPTTGGSHLPDITVITPFFHQSEILFVVASRGHHADIGGIAPGSMPPGSHFLYQEGARIKSFKLVSCGVFQEEGISNILLHDPAKFVDCSGTRNLRDNISDLKAQVAANQKGITLMNDLIREYDSSTVLSYMTYIRSNAELAVRQLMVKVASKYGNLLCAEDFMDDGSRISLRIEIDETTGGAIFDFSETTAQVWGNLNAPISVSYSAVIYCIRCLIEQDIPLNQGCLAPICIKIKEGTLLCPDEDRAIVGGNVLTSQRVVDVILKAFKTCAASQGCMNNLTFGMCPDMSRKLNGWGYYETIAGGSGAGPTWDGKDGVHTHMTNTRITDPEILERRYPVLLRRFEFRSGSGGKGRHCGGNGIVRELEFNEVIQVSILSDRRVFEPYGLEGGSSGARGMNFLYRNGTQINIGGKCTLLVNKGDILQINTPGGGGYGSVENMK